MLDSEKFIILFKHFLIFNYLSLVYSNNNNNRLIYSNNKIPMKIDKNNGNYCYRLIERHNAFKTPKATDYFQKLIDQSITIRLKNDEMTHEYLKNETKIDSNENKNHYYIKRMCCAGYDGPNCSYECFNCTIIKRTIEKLTVLEQVVNKITYQLNSNQWIKSIYESSLYSKLTRNNEYIFKEHFSTIDGNPGTKGNKGLKGLKGNEGNSGYKGFSGSKGEKGEKGRIGIVGIIGDQGIKGDDYYGTKGIEGTKGKPGPKGDVGDSGDDGGDGTPGENGDITSLKEYEYVYRKSGNRGDEGNRGVKGNRGDSGNMGEQGRPITELLNDLNSILLNANNLYNEMNVAFQRFFI